MTPREIIEELRPTEKQTVMSLLQKAGVDVSGWYETKGAPAANPKFCYNWTFLEPGELVVFSLWHRALRAEGNDVICKLGPRKPTELAPNKESIWKRRSDQMVGNLRWAFEQKIPLMALVSDGKELDVNDENPKASSVKLRKLDDTPWAVVEYNYETRTARLVRGAAPVDSTSLPVDPSALRWEGEERQRYVRHRRREDRARRAKIAETIAKNGGRLLCEVVNCGFDFHARYGEIGEGFADVHHLELLHKTPKDGRAIDLSRLAVVCANCHRMIHVRGESRPLEGLIT